MRMTWRSLTVLALALLIASPALAQDLRTVDDEGWCDDDGNRDNVQHCMVLETSLSAAALNVDGGGNGGISVKAWDGDRVRVRVRVSGWARDEDRAREIAEAVSVDIDGGDISTDGPRTGRNEWWGASYRIDVPRDTDLDLRSSNGGIRIDGVHGRIRFETSNGGVTLAGLGGDVEGKTSNGGLTVDLSGDTWEGERLDVRTQNGGVRVRVPDGYNAVLETGTVNGGINVDFPVQMQKSRSKRMTLELGNGGPELRVTTTNGGVRIVRS